MFLNACNNSFHVEKTRILLVPKVGNYFVNFKVKELNVTKASIQQH